MGLSAGVNLAGLETTERAPIFPPIEETRKPTAPLHSLLSVTVNVLIEERSCVVLVAVHRVLSGSLDTEIIKLNVNPKDPRMLYFTTIMLFQLFMYQDRREIHEREFE